MNKFDKLPALYHLGFYHPKFDCCEDVCNENYNFNEFSQLILDLKDRESEAIFYFESILTKLLEDEETTFVAVPSHIAFESNSGIRDLAGYLIKSKKKYIDAVKCLERVATVDKYSSIKGFRSEQEHFNSIVVKDRLLIENKNIILIDDILTSGNSANACRRLLSNAGAKEVKIVCLGKTIRGEKINITHDVIEKKMQDFIWHTDIEANNNIIQLKKEYHDLFCMRVQKLNENDEEGQFELECEMRHEEEYEIDNIYESIDYEKSEYCEYANEAHRALHGEGYLTPNNPFIQFL
jgi:hypoxanthine phosphoribosyltransferase